MLWEILETMPQILSANLKLIKLLSKFAYLYHILGQDVINISAQHSSNCSLIIKVRFILLLQAQNMSWYEFRTTFLISPFTHSFLLLFFHQDPMRANFPGLLSTEPLFLMLHAAVMASRRANKSSIRFCSHHQLCLGGVAYGSVPSLLSGPGAADYSSPEESHIIAWPYI